MARLSLSRAILEAMQGEGWMLARDIADKLQRRGWRASPSRVARIIAARLTLSVEVRPLSSSSPWRLYRLRSCEQQRRSL